MKKHGSLYVEPEERAAQRYLSLVKREKKDKKEKIQPKSKAKKETKVGGKRTHR